MNLLIISNMAHYLQGNTIVGWGPTVREIDALANLFDEIIHIGCLHEGLAPASSLPYSAENVKLIPVEPAGGPSIKHKVDILRLIPSYLRTVIREIRLADLVHVRCPANISLLAVLLLAVVRNPEYRWIKYAGNWQPEGHEPWSYAFQRWWLHTPWHRSVVTVNGNWVGQPNHIFSFINPSLTENEVVDGRRVALTKHMSTPVRLLYVGAINESKGIGRSLKIVRTLSNLNIQFIFDIIGDGPERSKFESEVIKNQLQDHVYFHGWQSRDNVAEFYERSHILLFPSATEGWPKVISEAMAYGVVPIAGAVSSIPSILSQTGAGLFFPINDELSFVDAICYYIQQPEEWKKTSNAGVLASSGFTYASYLESVRQMAKEAWGLKL